jgi:hypothetical protein
MQDGPFSAKAAKMSPEGVGCWRRPLGFVVRWELPEGCATHADAVSHEVEACEDGGHSGRQTAPGKAAECTLTGLHPGTLYQARPYHISCIH